MFNHHHVLTAKSALWEKPIIVFFLIGLFFSFSSLHGTETNAVSSSFDANDVPKSYDYILYPNSGPTFDDVLSLIHNRYNSNEKNIFKVALTNGTYNQYVSFVFYDNSTVYNDLYIEFFGLGTSVRIAGNNDLQSCSGNLHFKFNNLSITGGARGVKSLITPDSGALTFLEVQNCKIFGNAGTTGNFNENMDGAGIYSDGPATITGCEIYNNTGKNYWTSVGGVENFSRGGGIAVINNTSYETIIENNNIHHNTAIAGGGIYATGTGSILIKNNLVHNNTRSIYTTCFGDCQGGAGEGIWANECERLTLSGNIIKNQIPGTLGDRAPLPLSSATVVEYCGYSPSVTSVLIENNSFMDNDECHGLWLLEPEGGTLIRNNLSCNNEFGIYLTDYSNGYISMEYNNSYGNDTLNGVVQNYRIQVPAWIVQSNNGQFDPMVDSGYAPLWNTSVISPLIDSGYPGAFDPDGTPSDIGAVRAGDHEYAYYALPGANETIWMSFPVLNKVTNGYCMNGNFFQPILNPEWLQTILYKPYNCPITPISLYNGNWTNLTDVVNSLQGYKIQMASGAPANLAIQTSGYLQAPHTVIPLNQGENWLGYFLETSSNPLIALSPILDYIDRIQTQNWTMVKVPGLGWIHNGSWVLNYGDMVIVNALQACSFSWNNTQPVDPRTISKAKEFAYTEMLEYTPFYITIPDAKTVDLPSEIGLYVNGICKGAAVVDDELIHICAYLDDGEEITPDNSNLVFFYPTKAVPNNKCIYKFNTGQISMEGDGFTFYSSKITNLDKVTPVPQAAVLHQNYPNPFNPTTTIAYELPEDGLVQLSIYNLKGQLVRKLLDKPQSIGAHSVVWDGKDATGTTCSSGMYFYRVSYNGKSITKKMLMMK